MHAPFASVRLPDGERRQLFAGDLVGRGTSAHLRIPHWSVSEIHAMASLRGGQLELRALGGTLSLGGRVQPVVVLARDQTIVLSREVVLVVEDLFLPMHLLKVVVTGIVDGQVRGAEAVLSAAIHSVIVGPEIVRGLQPGALAHVWTTGAGYALQLASGHTEPLVPGLRLAVSDLLLACVAVPLADVGPNATVTDRRPIDLCVQGDRVTIGVRGRPALRLSAQASTIVSALLPRGSALPWHAVAERLWAGEADDLLLLRNRWDRALGRLRSALKDEGIGDFILSDGESNVTLAFAEQDAVTEAS